MYKTIKNHEEMEGAYAVGQGTHTNIKNGIKGEPGKNSCLIDNKCLLHGLLMNWSLDLQKTIRQDHITWCSMGFGNFVVVMGRY